MKLANALRTVFVAGLLTSLQTMAQQPPMQAPMAPQAIESQLAQKRTQEQREATEAKKSSAAATPAAATTTPSAAASDCASKAIGKNGKPLAGAAKAAFIKKCESDAKGSAAAPDCEAKAVGRDGKPLAGAAKAAAIKKCEGDTAKK